MLRRTRYRVDETELSTSSKQLLLPEQQQDRNTRNSSNSTSCKQLKTMAFDSNNDTCECAESSGSDAYIGSHNVCVSGSQPLASSRPAATFSFKLAKCIAVL
jgi:hypothetical protein